MSEEEIMKHIEEIRRIDRSRFTMGELEAIQGLLELYNKEKEKNKLLIQNKFREIADKNSYIKEMYISKDKIREEIEHLEKIADNGINAVRFAASEEDEIKRIQKQKDIGAMIDILQELLEE